MRKTNYMMKVEDVMEELVSLGQRHIALSGG